MKPDALERLVHGFADARVVCVGDVVLDRFVYGAAERVSREAPVITLNERRRTTMLGSAGNVARNVAALGGAPVLIGVVGDDPEGHEITALMADERGFELDVVTAKGCTTPVKTRYVASGQQVVCIDRDPRGPIQAEVETAVIDAVRAALEGAAALILSDYGRGVVTPTVAAGVIAAARSAGVPVIADPRGSDYRRYNGAHVIKPNAQELEIAAGTPCDTDENAIAALDAVYRDLNDVDHVLVTRGGRGMALKSADAPVAFFPSEPRDVYDVSGAGDTTIAALSLAIGAGAALSDAIEVANRAAGVVVTKVGTAVVTGAEVIADARGRRIDGAPVLSLEAAADQAARWRADGLSVGLTNGCFDVLHVGHLASLTAARSACDRLIVAINSDASVSRLKGPDRPINTEAERAALIAALAPVDAVLVFDADTASGVVEAVRPDVYVKGGDYTPDDLPEASAVAAVGGRIVITPLTPDRSTTATLKRVAGLGADETAT